MDVENAQILTNANDYLKVLLITQQDKLSTYQQLIWLDLILTKWLKQSLNVIQIVLNVPDKLIDVLNVLQLYT